MQLAERVRCQSVLSVRIPLLRWQHAFKGMLEGSVQDVSATSGCKLVHWDPHQLPPARMFEANTIL
jgi:hypothetical protein